MSLSVTTIANPLATRLVKQTVTDSTADDDVLNGAGGTLYMLQVDNTANTEITYVKIREGTGSGGGGTIQVGTDDPTWIFGVPASVTRTFAVPNGVAFPGVLGFWAVKEAGTAGITSPDNSTVVCLLVN